MPGVSAPVFHRYVALGDSFTEGVGDPDPDRPNGLRGWADRVAEVLATRTDDFGYANLAIRGRTLRPILAEQLEPALALRPDLVTIYAGGNDLIRPRCDVDALADGVRRGDRHARRERRPGRRVHRLRPRWWRSLRATAWTVRGLQRAGARDRRAARSPGPRLVADAAGPSRPDVVRGPAPPRAARPPGGRHRGARHTRRPARPRPVRPDRVARRDPLPGRTPGRPRVGGARTPRRGSSDASPGGPRATASRPSGRPWSRSDGSYGLGYDPHAGSPVGGCSSVGRARPSQGRCREFESRHPLRVIPRSEAPGKDERNKAHRHDPEQSPTYHRSTERSKGERWSTPAALRSRARDTQPTVDVNTGGSITPVTPPSHFLHLSGVAMPEKCRDPRLTGYPCSGVRRRPRHRDGLFRRR